MVSDPRVRLVNHVLRQSAAVLFEPQDRVVDAVGLGCFHQRKPSAHAVSKPRALLKAACGSQHRQGSHRPIAAIGIRYKSQVIQECPEFVLRIQVVDHRVADRCIFPRSRFVTSLQSFLRGRSSIVPLLQRLATGRIRVP